MAQASRFWVALALLGLITAPLHADVIPTQYPGKSAAKEALQKSLTGMGLTSGDASARAGRLTEEEAAFFTGKSGRIVLVGQEFFAGQVDSLWWEFLFGAGALVAVGIGIHYAVDN